MVVIVNVPSGTPPSPRDPSPGCRGRGCPPPPKRCRGPLGWKPQGKPVRAFLHPANAGQVRAPHGVRGPPRSRSPSYSPGLPLSRAGFSPPPQGVQAPLRQRVLPTAHLSPFVPAATGPGSRPRGSPVRPRYLPPSRLRYALAACVALSPYEVPELGVLRARPGLHGPQAGGSEQRGSRTPPVTGLAIVRPRLSGAGLPSRFPWSAGPPVSLSPLVPRGTLSTGLLRTRDGAMGSPHPVGGPFTHFPAVSPGGFDPQDPFRVAQSRPRSLGVCGLRSNRRLCPRSAALSAGRARIFPRHPASPAFAIGVAAPRLLVRPRHHPG